MVKEEKSNIKTGTDFETEFCQLASEKGFWAHRLNANRRGQPSDVIISMNNIAALVDCKVCEHMTFPFDRIEDNQEYAMTRWKERGNYYTFFALKLGDEIRMIGFSALMSSKYSGLKQLNFNQIMARSLSFEEWVNSIWTL